MQPHPEESAQQHHMARATEAGPNVEKNCVEEKQKILKNDVGTEFMEDQVHGHLAFSEHWCQPDTNAECLEEVHHKDLV